MGVKVTIEYELPDEVCRKIVAAGSGGATPIPIPVPTPTPVPAPVPVPTPTPTPMPPGTLLATLTWGQGRMLPDAYGGQFYANDVIAAALSVPTSGAGLMNAACAEWQGPPTFRQMTISLTPADFRPVDPSGVNGPIKFAQGNNAMTGAFVGFGDGLMNPGRMYYINIRNYSPDIGGCSCGQTACNMALDFHWT